MSLYDANDLIWGASDDPNLTDANDAAESTKYDFSAALDEVSLGYIIPAKQADGATDTSGTLTLALKFYDKDDNLLGTYTSAAISRSASGVVGHITVSRPFKCTKISVTPTVSAGGNVGVATIGWTLGVNLLSDAG